MPARPGSYERKRAEIGEELASLVLRKGLKDLSLRHLARERGTSDRMLLYYFRTSEALVTAVLRQISRRLDGILAQPSPRLSTGDFLERVLALSADPRVGPFMKIWAEIISRGARGEKPYRKIAGAIVGKWLTWIESRLRKPKAGEAAAVLAIVEGVTLLEMARRGST